MCVCGGGGGRGGARGYSLNWGVIVVKAYISCELPLPRFPRVGPSGRTKTPAGR